MNEKIFLDNLSKVRKNQSVKKSNGIEWVYDEKILSAGALHGFTRRIGGFSPPPFDSLNFGFTRPEPREIIIANYALLATSAGFNFNDFAIINFEHGNNVLSITSSDRGKGIIESHGCLLPCDGLVTACSDVVPVSLHADCLGILLYDPVKRAVGALHSGWKGVHGEIGVVAAQKMHSEYLSNPKDILIMLTPSISQKNYEVDRPVFDLFNDKFDLPSSAYSYYCDQKNKYYLDLSLITVFQLLNFGIKPENISLSQECTYDNPEYYYSYRRDGKKAGDMAGFIKLI